MQLHSQYISRTSNAFWDSSHAARCLQKCCCLPTITAIWLVHQPWWQSRSAYLFNRPRTAPPGAHMQQHTLRAAGQVYGWNLVLGNKLVSWVEPQTLVSQVPYCLPNKQPVLPNAYYRLVAFCKAANMQALTWPLHLLTKLLLSCHVYLEFSYGVSISLEILYVKQVFAWMTRKLADSHPSFSGAFQFLFVGRRF